MAVPILATEKLNENFVTDIHAMFENEDLVDFKLKTNDNEVLSAHKVILAARSPVFYGMVTSEMKEAKEGVAEVPDFDSKIMKEVLRFIYCNEVENLEEIADELIVAADKYQIEQLKSLCIENLIEETDAENVCQMILLSQRVSNATNLFESCLDVVRG
jgi:speckle-type POZ protein